MALSSFEDAELSPAAYAGLAAAVLVVAAVLRFWDLGGPSLWFDEAVYALNSHGSFADVLLNTRTNNSTPLFLPLLLNLLHHTVGLDEFAARLPSAVAGTASVLVLLLLPLTGASRTVALLAGTLAAFGQMQILYSQEVREYGLSMLVSSLILWTFLFALSAGRIWPLVVVLAATPWISYGPCFAGLAAIVTLALFRILGRTALSFGRIALALAVLLVSAGLAYVAVARYQMGMGKQWYLLEHYFRDSGMGIVEWLATNTSGVLLASLPGLVGVLGSALIIAAYIVVSLRRPAELLASPGFVAAVVLVFGLMAAGILGIYPYGSPRHTVFVGPFIAFAVAVALHGLIARARPAHRAAVAAFGAFVILAGAVTSIFAIPIGAGLHPALAKVAKVRIYGEYENNRALVRWAASHGDLPLYGSDGVAPAVAFYNPSLQVRFDRADATPESMADNIAAFANGGKIAVLLSHMLDGQVGDLEKNLKARGLAVVERFSDVLVDGFVVQPDTAG